MTGRTPLACLLILAAFMAALIFSPVASAGTGCVIITGPSTDPCASMSIDKYGPYVVTSGDTAEFTYYVYNTGSEPISDVVVTDDHCSPVTGPTNTSDTILMPYGSPDYPYFTFTCSYAITGAPGSFVDNIATVHGIANESDVSATSNTHRTYISALQVTKDVDLTTADPYDELHYTITVKNVDTDSEGPSYYGFVDDQGCEDLTATDPQATGFGFQLAPGESITYTCHHNFNPGSGEGQDPDPYVNEACAYAYLYRQEAVTPQEFKYDIKTCDDASTSVAKHVVSGQKFEDMNADGVRQLGEPALPGMVVYADLNDNSKRDEGEPSSTSDGQGDWSLPIELGTTVIREDTVSPFTCSFPSGCAYTIDLPKNSPPPPPQVASRRVAGRVDDPTGKDFGDWRPATVTGTVVGDTNGNGVRDAGENGLAGVAVFADLNGNGALDAGEPTVNSAGDGTYAIGGLKPGGYVIRHVIPAGRTCSAPSGGCSYSLTLVSNQTDPNRDFLDVPPAQAVLAARVIPGVARMAARSGCVSGSAYNARIRGRKIQRVVFSVDGKTMRTLVRPKDNKTYRFRVNVSKLSFGGHTVAARVTFRSTSGTKSKTIRLSFRRCALQVRTPKFTG
jgi:hypothetical protein